MAAKNEYTVRAFSKKNWGRNLETFTECSEWEPSDFALAAMGPTGYLAHLFAREKRGEKINEGQYYEEIADAVIYLDLLCTSLGGNLEEVIARKFNDTSAEEDCEFLLPRKDNKAI